MFNFLFINSKTIVEGLLCARHFGVHQWTKQATVPTLKELSLRSNEQINKSQSILEGDKDCGENGKGGENEKEGLSLILSGLSNKLLEIIVYLIGTI